jgi:hypothetical protein
MSAALNEQDLLCRVFGRCRHGATIDREVGDLVDNGDGGDRLGLPGDRMFTYMRYNAELSKKGLTDLGLGAIRPENVQKMDSVAHIKDLQAIGQAVAERDVNRSHFDGVL